MDKQNLIDNIETLFPIDSSFPDTAAVGERLLIEAVKESDWRDLPADILALYAAKCEREENRQARNVRKRL